MKIELKEETLDDIKNNPISRAIIKLMVLGAVCHMRVLKARQTDARDYLQTWEGKRHGYFDSARVLELESMQTTDLTDSFKELILSFESEFGIHDAINELEEWIDNAKTLGF